MMHAMAGTLHLGTSGFSFDGWKHGVFYPEGLKNREMLTYYSQQLSSVEINYTFRRFPTEKSLTTWREQAAEGFTFTLKANQRITHFKRLADTDEDVRAFLELAKLLGDKLGCVLFQCPPSLHYDRALIEAFVGYLPPGGRFAMEFRHASWIEAKDLLLSQGVAWCVAETDEKDPGPDDLSWEPVGYLRLRKTEYPRRRAPSVGRSDRPRARRGRRRLLLLQARGGRGGSEDGEAAARDVGGPGSRPGICLTHPSSGRPGSSRGSRRTVSGLQAVAQSLLERVEIVRQLGTERVPHVEGVDDPSLVGRHLREVHVDRRARRRSW